MLQADGERARAARWLRLPAAVRALPVPVQDAGTQHVAALARRAPRGSLSHPDGTTGPAGGVCLRQDQDLHQKPQTGKHLVYLES